MICDTLFHAPCNHQEDVVVVVFLYIHIYIYKYIYIYYPDVKFKALLQTLPVLAETCPKFGQLQATICRVYFGGMILQLCIVLGRIHFRTFGV